jgi:hypothetical protein
LISAKAKIKFMPLQRLKWTSSGFFMLLLALRPGAHRLIYLSFLLSAGRSKIQVSQLIGGYL